MVTAKIQTGGLKTAVHKPMDDITDATSIIYTVYVLDLLLCTALIFKDIPCVYGDTQIQNLHLLLQLLPKKLSEVQIWQLEAFDWVSMQWNLNHLVMWIRSISNLNMETLCTEGTHWLHPSVNVFIIRVKDESSDSFYLKAPLCALFTPGYVCLCAVVG